MHKQLAHKTMGVARLWSIALKISEFVAFLYSAETMTLHWDDWVVYYEKFPRLVSWSPPPLTVNLATPLDITTPPVGQQA